MKKPFTIKCLLSRVFISALIIMLGVIDAKAQIPSASFTADSTQGCVPLTVHFSNSSIHATSFFWDFGNGNTSTLPNPQTVYLSPGNFTVKLIAYNNVSGKSDTLVMTNYINVVSFPNANFTSNVTSGCSPLAVSFTNTSTNYTSCVWDFGDGFSSTQTNPSHTYTVPGFYTVKLIAYSAYGCSNVKTQLNYIRVYGKPTAQLTANPTSTCNANQIIQFNSASTGVTSYQWNFGQPSSGAANTSSLQNPTHTYGTQGSFNVSLIVTDANGCADTAVINNMITIGNALTPTFTWNKSSGCMPLTVNFTAPNITGATSYVWNFGDPSSGAQNTSSVANPSHTYANAGSYSVSLFVTTSSGCNGGVTLNNIITVDQPPVAAFTANQTSGCKPLNVQFNNTSSGATSYLWEFGDGTTSTLSSPTKSYTTAGTYTVTLHAYSANGCETIEVKNNFITVNEAKANFAFTPNAGCAPLAVNFSPVNMTGIVSYLWNFGDPASGALNTSTLSNPSHTYNNLGSYTIKLRVISSAGCVDSISKSFVNVNSSSVTYTVPDTIKGCQPYPVSFVNPLTGASIFHWDFGVPWLTNDTSNVANPSFVFDSVGIYTVNLTATMAGNNGTGCTQVFNPIAYVQVFPMILSPITYIQATPCAPYLIHFSDTTMDVVSWDWDFGDGTPHDTTQFPSHTYAQPGTYTVILHIVLQSGCMTSLSTTLTLGKTNPITVNKKAGCHDEPFSFGLSGGPWTNISWNFGDGVGTSTSATPTYTYNLAGNFIVTLNATGNDGCNYTFKDTIKTTNPQPSFVINGPTSSCTNLFVFFTNTSTGATSYLWDFGDPTSSTGYSTLVNPSRNFTTPKNYTITLTATNGACSRSVTYPAMIRINRATPNFSFTQSSQCFPITVTLTDLTAPVPAIKWGWNFYNGSTDSTQNPVYTFYAPPATDTISLWVRDTNGCSATKRLKGITYKEAKFTMSSTGGCKPATICFTDASDSGAVSWQWDFGNGATSTLKNPCYTYTTDGVYTVTLITTFNTGCKDTLVMPNAITISTPVANFNAPAQSFCAPALVNFNNLSTNATTYLWDFGDGSTSIAASPSHVYNVPGDYTVTLVAINGTCRDTLKRINYLHIPGTFSYFNLVSLQSCVGNLVQFTDSSLNAQTWLWNFGDGDSSTLQNPTHLYSTTGSFTVSLITSDNLGCSSHYIFSNPIVVHPVPTAIATTTDTVGCSPYTATFTENSLNATSYLWNFGDPASGALNTATTSTATHTYNTSGLFQPYLVAYNSYGCTDTMWLPKKINVKQTPTAQFTTSSNNGCTPLTVNFSNTSTFLNNPSYAWSFGNGNTATTANATTVYADSGLFNVTLTVTNAGGCSSSASATISSVLSPVAIASTTDTVGCNPHTVSFSNNSTNATSYLWNFGNGVTSTLPNPNYTYVNAGNYTVTLIATNASGCSDTLILPQIIQVKQTPRARFNFSPATGCTPLSVNFTNTSANTSGATYSWNFGNGNTANTANASTVYADSGTYAVTLWVTNSNGCSDDSVRYVRANLSPTASATTNDTTGCNPYTSTFVNNSTNATSYQWFFGDGGSSTQPNPTHTYPTSGLYGVTLIATNAAGCRDTFRFSNTISVNQTPLASFTSSVTSGCAPLAVNFTNTSTVISGATYSWDFGNGQTSTLANPSVSYTDSGTYQVVLVVSNGNGCFHTATQYIHVNISPNANFTTTDTSGCTPHAVTFINNTTNANSYQWNFGNGGTSTSINPTYTYNTGGIYTVTLIATNTAGCRDTFTLPYPIIAKQSPRARFNMSPATGCSPLSVSFTNTSANTSGATYNWNLGNGNNATTTNTSTIYADSGTYAVTLWVTNSNGCADDTVRNVRVNLSPTALAATNDTAGCHPYSVSFTNSSINATSYQWSFGDGNTSTVQTPTHTYNSPGNYTVTLIATNSAGCKDTFVIPNPIHVYQTPVAQFSASATSGCAPLTVNFTNTSTGTTGASYDWNFGDSTTSNVSNPTYTFTTPGTYSVVLTVTNSTGCLDTVFQNIQVYSTPTALASTSDTSGCSPLSVQFNNGSLNATSYQWNFGNGITSSATNPVYQYNNGGLYTASLIAINSNGCRDTFILPYSINVKQSPLASFNMSSATGCTPLSVAFTNSSQNTAGPVWNWSFGNGFTSNAQNPSTIYADSGHYQITLWVMNSNGCMDDSTQTILANLTPTAQASTFDTLGCSPYQVSFSNNSIHATSYQWNFGDGITSTTPVPNHTYTNAGNYTITLTAISSAGCSDTLTLANTVTVNQTPVAAFATSTNTGCTPLSVGLTNTSTQIIGATYSWDFGNGTTSNALNPMVQYTDSGTYTIHLTTTNQNGCSDSASQTIRANLSPIANGFTSDTVGCTPFSVSFINNSLHTNSVWWNFGDGTTSTLTAPQHTYNTAGNYTVTLIVNNVYGCSDTLVLPQTIHVHQTPVASFTMSPSSGCSPLSVNFTNTSSSTVNPSYQWNFGNGSTSTAMNPTYSYTSSGLFNATLITTNASGCSDSSSSAITVLTSPTANGFTNDTTGCSPYTVNFTSTSINSDSVVWYLGNGQSMTGNTIQYTYTQPGLFQPYLVAYNAAGCRDTFYLPKTIKVRQSPVANFSASQTASCSGTNFTFNNLSTDTISAVYVWTVGGFSTSNPSFSIPLLNPGFYNVSLTVTNANGCSDTEVKTNYIQVYDTLPPPQDPIYSVSVLSNTQVEITWANSSALDLGAYKLWRLDPSSGNYVNVYTDNNPANSSMNPESKYVENGLNTLSNTYTYKLQTLDRCNYALPLSALKAHTTINVSAQKSGSGILVSWTPYGGCAVSNYEITRVELSNGSSAVIATVPGNKLSYLDSTMLCPDIYSYRIKAYDLCGLAYTSLSDTAAARPDYNLQDQQAIIVRSTVVNNHFVLTEWSEPRLHPERVASYNIYRSTDTTGNFYSLLATVSSNVTSYEDYDVNVDAQNYYYKIEVVSDCNLSGTLSSQSSSILLQSKWEYANSRLWWTRYEKWDTGVERYEIEKYNWSTGQWEKIKTVPGNATETEVDE
jgi:PKD repeat protein